MAANTMFLSREDYRKKLELEELRKAGAAPAELDDEGKMINPHIPQYMAEGPQYASDGRPGLKHQRQFREKQIFAKIDEFVPRGLKKKQAATKYRSGACENCGAMTHKAKDCCERPRKKGAKYTNRDIKPDEIILEPLKQSYAGKRDRQNGYDINLHENIVEKYQKIEKARRLKKEKELDDALRNSESSSQDKKQLKKRQKRLLKAKRAKEKNKEQDSDSESESDSDSDSDASSGTDDDIKDTGQLIQQMDSKKRQTVRNLRIREDCAKYLLNLDPNSAFYDPKTRSMRGNPFPDIDPRNSMFAGENYSRLTGDALKFNNLRLFAQESEEKAPESQQSILQINSNPTRIELIEKEHKKKESSFKKRNRAEIIKKYGGEEHMNNEMSSRLLTGQTEQYRVYSSDGRVIVGSGVDDDSIPCSSKYVEDQFENGHTSIQGSYYDREKSKQGYACCHQIIRHVYCIGEAGKHALTELQQDMNRRQKLWAASSNNDTTEKQSKKLNSKTNDQSSNFRLYQDRPSAAEHEEYLKNKRHFDDPMRNFE